MYKKTNKVHEISKDAFRKRTYFTEVSEKYCNLGKRRRKVNSLIALATGKEFPAPMAQEVMSPRAALDVLEKRKILHLPGIENWSLCTGYIDEKRLRRFCLLQRSTKSLYYFCVLHMP
jgi:hypothetical protein